MYIVILRRKVTAMFTRLLRPPRTSFFLLGPRGTGKSTWIREHFADAHTFDLLDEGLYQSLLANPSLFAKELGGTPAGSWVVVDEVQRLPWILNEAHRLTERHKLKFALTGSSARKLRRGEVDLLSGRALYRQMFPLTPEELGKEFSLDPALRWGTLPLVWTSAERDETLSAYVQLYLREEIQAEALVRNLPGFARFLPIAALFHGQTLNTSSLARDAGVARTTIHGYLDILRDTLLADTLPAYEGSLRVREKKHPKLYFFDPGVVRALKRARGPVLTEEKGALLEGFVLMLLRLHQAYDRLFDDVYYWSPAEAQRTEVDFLVVRGAEKWAVEVKASARLRDDFFWGLRAIRGLKGLKRRVLVYLGDRALTLDDGIEVLPFEKFARGLA